MHILLGAKLSEQPLPKRSSFLGAVCTGAWRQDFPALLDQQREVADREDLLQPACVMHICTVTRYTRDGEYSYRWFCAEAILNRSAESHLLSKREACNRHLFTLTATAGR